MKEYIPDFKIVSRVLIFFMIIFSGVTSIHAQWELVDSIEYNQFITSPGFQNSINGAPVDCHLDVLQRSASIQKVVSPGDFAAVSYKLEAGFIYRYSFFVKPRDSEVYYHMKISKASGDSILDYAKGQTGDQNFTYTSGEFLGVDGAAASCGVIHKITSGPVVGDDSTRLLKVECSRVNKTGTSMRATRFARCYIERKFDDSNPIPTAPDSFMVKTFTDSASFTWVDRAFNEKGFKLERKEAGGEFQEIAAIDSNKTSFTDKTLLKNIAYHYRIYAWNDSGVSAFSDTIGVILYDAPPDKPTAFTLLVKDSRRIDLSWNDESNDEYGFVLQYSTTGTWDDFTEISFDPGTTTFNHYRLDQNALYDYRLFAQNNMGSSDTVYASAATPQPGPEDGYLLPDDDFIINVIDFGATGDGQTDDTEALQEAMNYGVGKFVYFPDGTYLISDRLEWPDDARFAPLIIFGQSRENTIIQLTDDNPLFQSDTRAVVWTNKMGSADNFRNYIKHITVNTGSGNPGAVGVQFMSNNMGAIEDISIISGDGTGKIGLDLAYNGLNGPLLVKNVSISGFDIGIKSSGEVNSQTMEHVNLEGQ
ncbi:MAG: fibronectin type III domain-containing protein, partial [Bacteroidales bacterium]